MPVKEQLLIAELKDGLIPDYFALHERLEKQLIPHTCLIDYLPADQETGLSVRRDIILIGAFCLQYNEGLRRPYLVSCAKHPLEVIYTDTDKQPDTIRETTPEQIEANIDNQNYAGGCDGENIFFAWL